MDEPNEREWYDDWRGAPQLGLPPTSRQIEIFLAVLRWKPMAAAHELGISYQTLKNHMTGLMARTGTQSRAELASYLWENYPELRDAMVLPDDALLPDPVAEPHERPSGDDGLFTERRHGQRRRKVK